MSLQIKARDVMVRDVLDGSSVREITECHLPFLGNALIVDTEADTYTLFPTEKVTVERDLRLVYRV